MKNSFMKISGAVAGALMFAAPLQAQSVEEFYSGKTVELYIGYSVGGGYDTYARTIASHIGKHIPGNPTVVAQNMPGAGSLRLTNWLYQAAPQDGTVFGTISRSAPFEPLIGNQAADFQADQLNYIGNANKETSLCASTSASGIESIEEVMESTLLVGGTGAGSDPGFHAEVLNATIGTQFEVIDGYPGGNDVVLAMERGEVGGRCGWSWSSVKSRNMEMVEDGSVTLLVQIANNAHPDLPDVPLAIDLAPDQRSRQLINFIVAPQEMGRPYVAPPNVPADRLAALRAAFVATMNDPDFLAEAAATNLEITPTTGEEMQAVVESVYATDPAVIEEIVAIQQ
ncbi:Bug family tripartite tricarboxylate transporter substrate binding protein [Rhodosalinus sp. FB01]|uniref:Bug family tripartite tricarboxylate transporter substrate binding protein n=1 Tax=Rhodosalinus sp. FB01 TaxID=3239194 RepID=UPI003525E2D4